MVITRIFTAFLSFLTITDYRPKVETPLQVKNNTAKALKNSTEFSVITFNIGYCGLDKNQDFFMDGGEIRKKQLDFLKSYITGEYSKGNYVITGGDWNHQLPGTDSSKFKTTESWPFWLQKLPDDFTPADFKWGVDKTVPSNRTVAKAYTEGQNYLSIIDGFLVSPNVDIISIKGHDFGFENSDHNPATGVFILK